MSNEQDQTDRLIRWRQEQVYMANLSSILIMGFDEHNARTGKRTKSRICCGLVNEDSSILPLLHTRKIYVKSAAAELAWTLKGDKNKEFISNYSSMWNKFADQDGNIETAYGYRWQAHFKRDQLYEAISLLKKDPSSRQAVVMAWDPSWDGLLRAGMSKNVPCPIGFQMLIKGGKLNIHVFQRSMDMVLGAPYDMLMYSLLNCAASKSLGVEPGATWFSISDAHIYDYLETTAERMLKNWHTYKQEEEMQRAIRYNSWSIEDIKANPSGYVSSVSFWVDDWYKPMWISPRLEPTE